MTASAVGAAGDTSRLVIEIGGSTGYRGGTEAFCTRAHQALEANSAWRVLPICADTAYLSPARLPALFRGLTRLMALGRSARPDCVWIQYSNMPDLAYVVVARLMGLRVLVTPHLGKQWRSRANPVLRLFSRLGLRLSHRIALISVTQEADLDPPRSVPWSMIRTFLPAAIVMGGAEPAETADGPIRLLHASRLSVEKGTFLFLDMCASLQALGVPFDATIAGGADRSVVDDLEGRIVTMGLSGRVAYVGMLAEDEMFAAMRRADVLVHLSRQDSYPLVVLEAMGCGAVPICYDLAGARQMIETYDGLCIGGEDLASEAARWVAKQPPLELRERGKRIAERIREDFAWKHCAGALADALEACALRRGNTGIRPC